MLCSICQRPSTRRYCRQCAIEYHNHRRGNCFICRIPLANQRRKSCPEHAPLVKYLGRQLYRKGTKIYDDSNHFNDPDSLFADPALIKK